jgi:hypothetical protein
LSTHPPTPAPPCQSSFDFDRYDRSHGHRTPKQRQKVWWWWFLFILYLIYISAADNQQTDDASGHDEPPSGQDPILSADEFTSSDGELTEAEREEVEEIVTSSSGFFASPSIEIHSPSAKSKSELVEDFGHAYLEPLLRKAKDAADYPVTSGSGKRFGRLVICVTKDFL